MDNNNKQRVTKIEIFNDRYHGQTYKNIAVKYGLVEGTLRRQFMKGGTYYAEYRKFEKKMEKESRF